MLKCRLTLPQHVMLESITTLAGESRALFGFAVQVAIPDGFELLLSKVEHSTRLFKSAPEGRVPMALRLDDTEIVSIPALQAWRKDVGLAEADDWVVATLTRKGGISAVWYRGGVWTPIHEFYMPGAGMDLIRHGDSSVMPMVHDAPPAVRDSRLAGALTLPVLNRLRQLSFAIVGVSRVGGEVAKSLIRLGVSKLVLVDPDVVESHNADAGPFHPILDEGQPKVEALGRALARIARPGTRIVRVAHPLRAPISLQEVGDAHVIISCVDDDGARLLASMIAASRLRVHLDIGTHVSVGDRVVGADVRLVIPEARGRCLACFGGFSDMSAIKRAAKLDDSPPPLWSQQRAGSLRSLNQVAAHLGLRILERLVEGQELRQSTWLRYVEQPRIQVREVVPSRGWTCKVCETLYGGGPFEAGDTERVYRRLVSVLQASVNE